MNLTIRSARPADAAAMAVLMVDTWFEAHRGQVADQVYEERRRTWGYTESESGWRETIENSGADPVLLAIHQQQIVGLAYGQLQAPAIGELKTLYVDIRYHGLGVGRQLFEAQRAHLQQLGANTLTLSVLASNQPARDFYEHLGGTLVDAQAVHPDGPAVIYAWPLL